MLGFIAVLLPVPPVALVPYHNKVAAEAGVSRFYGGIHFMDAITNGQQQGGKVGEWLLQKIK